ncbi:PREDICTED: cyclin-dependent kinase inhibitor 4-like isoform X1 [Brassica oleracea var. oleracea]|uniref:Cyclin-dependent kinase inhibitor domain-containing protein n=1 Tax=Brassica oleracea var. oleracea TaxID=109376 RepID=A0A0D3BSQ4_BRAOL|nr:PREDICTED: cyclin-dependent kinase inhibitor 4-like isoform X1 [Brassica oleracea var. oleracea]
MGKYMRKSKIDGEAISLLEVSPSSPSSSLGVLTRAKSLALQRKPSSSFSLPTSPSPSPNQKTSDCGGSYLQLRSRRLQKKPPIVVIKRRKQQQRRKESCGRSPKPDSVVESGVGSKEKVLNDEINNKGSTSLEENLLELQGNESLNRSTSESTPCTLKREAEINTSLGSSTKLNNGISDNSDQIEENLSGSHRPTTPDMDRFFSGAEEEQQKQFIEKYNFDPVNEQPLPGRFEWEKVDN